MVVSESERRFSDYIDTLVENFLRKQGFKVLRFEKQDGYYETDRIVDEHGLIYSAKNERWVVSQKEEPAKGGKNVKETITTSSGIDLENGGFDLIYQQKDHPSYEHVPGGPQFPGKAPCSEDYNAVILTRIGEWGHPQISTTLYRVLALNVGFKEETKFIRDLTPEEQAEKERELAEPPW